MVDTKFKYLTGTQRKYIKNKVSNIVRKANYDVYNVWVSDSPMAYAQYAHNETFLLNDGTEIYVHIQVD